MLKFLLVKTSIRFDRFGLLEGIEESSEKSVTYPVENCAVVVSPSEFPIFWRSSCGLLVVFSCNLCDP